MKALGAVVVLAAEGAASSFDVTGVMQTAVSNVQSSVFGTLAIVVPVIAAITGAVVAVKFGLSWLKRIKG